MYAPTGTPLVALVVNLSIGIVAIVSGRTAEIITLACFGALCLYILSMISLFVLRRREPQLERPFRAVLYPWFPALALVIATVALIAMTAYNLQIAAIFAAILFGGGIYFVVFVRGRADSAWASSRIVD